MVGMKGAANRPIGELSKGMARRVGLAQALINDPELLILDEPTSGLDPIGCREIKDIIKTLAKRGKTVLICSHVLADIQDVCSKVLIMYGGKIRAEGPVDELLNVEEKTRIVSSKIDEKVLEKILKLLDDNTIVDHPMKSLEEFFLDVVNKAKSEMGTAGATSDGQIATFLAGDESSNQILEALNKEASEEMVEEENPEDIEPDVEKLEALTKDDTPEEIKEADQPVKKELTQEEKSQKNKDIEDILKKKQ